MLSAGEPIRSGARGSESSFVAQARSGVEGSEDSPVLLQSLNLGYPYHESTSEVSMHRTRPTPQDFNDQT